MAEKERSFGNWVGNTVRVPQRVVGTAGLLGADIVKTSTGVVKDFGNVVTSTTNKIVDLFSKDKKRYQKLLNIPVAAGVGIVGAVEAVVKPVVNGVINTGKTAVNVTTNAWKSTFGSVFSARPVSDISFNTVKTKKGIVSVDTEKSSLNPNKPRTSNRGNRSKKKISKPAATAGAAVATTAAVSAKEINSLNAKVDELTSQVSKLATQLKDALESNKKLLNENESLKKQLEAQKKDKKEGNTESKPEEKIEKKSEDKSDKKAENNSGDKQDSKPEAKPETQKTETPADKGSDGKEPESKETDEGKKADRGNYTVEGVIEKGSKCETLLNFAKKKRPNLEINFKKDTPAGHVDLKKNELIVGTEMPKDEIMLAIANEDHNETKQIKHVLAHELAHIVLFDQTDDENIKGLKNLIKNTINSNGKPLTKIATMSQYKTIDDKVNEDFCEIIALYSRDNGDFDKYMKSLINGSDGVQISDSDCEKIKGYCEKIFNQISVK